MQGIKLLQWLEISQATLYSDSLNAVNMISGDTEDPSTEVRHWIIQIQDMCKTFTSLRVYHIARRDNWRADRLTKEALCQRNSMLWMSNFPSWLVSKGQNAHCKCIEFCKCYH